MLNRIINTSETTGVYKLYSLITGDVYIGGAKRLTKRKNNHFSDLRKQKHHCKPLQELYNKYGETNIIFEVIENCSELNLLNKEQYYIDTLNPSLNIYKFAGSSKGFKQSEETVQKSRDRIASIDTRNKISNAAKGNKRCLGRVLSDNTKEKIGSSKYIKVYQYTLKGELIKEWESLKAIGHFYGKDRAFINKYIITKNPFDGFLWSKAGAIELAEKLGILKLDK